MKQSEIIELTDEEVRERLEDLTETYSKMKINHAVSELDNPQTLKYNRRTIARLKTEVHKREMAASKKA